MGFFLTFLFYAGLTVLWQILKPKPEFENAKPDDLRLPTTTEGRAVPLLWGTAKIAPNIVWHDGGTPKAIKEEVKTGIFSSEDVVKGFRYFVGMQHALCEGPLDGTDDGLLRVWIGDDEVWSYIDDNGSIPVGHGDSFTINEPDLFGGEDLGQGGVVGTLEFFAGTDSQLASSYLSTFQQHATTLATPAYRNTAYCAPLTDAPLVGTSPSIAPWFFELRRIPDGLSLGTDALIDGGANPANVLYEVLTNDNWGRANDPSTIDTASFAAAGATLAAEGNGFSFLLEQVEELEDLILRIQEQCDLVLRQNITTGLYEIKLVRADYDPNTVPEMNVSNIVETRRWTQSTWEGVSNAVRTPFRDAEDNYKDTAGYDQDLSTFRMLGRHRTATLRHPGVKRGTLATSLASRELRTVAQPQADGEWIVDRSLFGVQAGDVVAFTLDRLGANRIPIRIRSVNYNRLLEGEIRISGSQDVFFQAAGTFDPPGPSDWTPPADNLVDVPVDERVVIEAPRAITSRSPLLLSPEVDVVFVAARQQGTEASFLVYQRNGFGTPAGAFAQTAQSFFFVLIGELAGALTASETNPVSSVTLTATPDSQADLLLALPSLTDLVSLGSNLETLCLIGDELVLVRDANASGADVQLVDVYRGIADTVQGDHVAGDKVYLLFAEGGVLTESIPAGNTVDIKILPKSTQGTLAEASATASTLTMDNRTRRPYPPASFTANGNGIDTAAVDIDGSGSGEDVGILVACVRRDFRTVDEVAALSTDAATIFTDFPTVNSTEIVVRILDGSTQLTENTDSSSSLTVRQLDVLEALDTTTLPATLTMSVGQRHTLSGTVYDSLSFWTYNFTVTSAFVGLHAFGALDNSDVSAAFVVGTAARFTFTMSSAFTAGDVEYRINAGAWTTLIAAGGTAGIIPGASLATSDTVEIRHLSTDTDAQKLIELSIGGGVGLSGYGVLRT